MNYSSHGNSNHFPVFVFMPGTKIQKTNLHVYVFSKNSHISELRRNRKLHSFLFPWFRKILERIMLPSRNTPNPSLLFKIRPMNYSISGKNYSTNGKWRSWTKSKNNWFNMITLIWTPQERTLNSPKKNR